MNTYNEIQAFVVKKHGWTPQTCWIAHAKALCGLAVIPAQNRKGKARLNPWPPDKLPAIREAMKAIGMLKK